MSDTIRVVADDGVHIAAHLDGREGRRVLFIHGWMASSGTWQFLWPHLDTRGLVTARVDLRGAGASDKPATGYTLERYGLDLLAVVDHLGWDRFTVVGHSMGGQLAQWLGARVPGRVEALALVCPVPQAGIPMPPEAVALFSTAGGDAHKLGTILTLATKDIGTAERQQLTQDALAQPAACINEGYQAFSAGFGAELSAIRAPTLVIGTEDPFLPVPFLQEAVVGKIAGARLAFLPGAGHYPQHERSAHTAALLTAFFAGLGAAG